MIGWLRRIVDVRDDELGALCWSFLYFFTLLFGYYILRPIRDEMGIAGGTSKLPWLFTATFLAMLIAVPIFSAVVARFPRHRVIPIVYRFFLANLVIFFVLLRFGVARAQVAVVFFVWTSVYNLFVVSIFWSFMADLWVGGQGKRLFGFIAAGGSLGAIAGPLCTASLVTRIGATNLILVSCVLLEASVQCVRRLSRWAGLVTRTVADRPVGGGMLDGIVRVFRSPYLLGICGQTLFFTITSTILYTQQAHIVAGAIADPAARTQLFARIDTAVNVITVVLQLVLTGRLMARVGLTLSLGALPALTGAGFLALAAAPVLWVIVVFQALRRSVHYALERPAREVLFTAVSRDDKYKSKSFIDTVVYRAGDAASGWIFGGEAAVGLGIAGTALLSVPVAGAWFVVAWLLARAFRVRMDEKEELS